MIEENDSSHDNQRWNDLWNNPDLTKREAFRLWNKSPNLLTKKQRLLIQQLFKNET